LLFVAWNCEISPVNKARAHRFLIAFLLLFIIYPGTIVFEYFLIINVAFKSKIVSLNAVFKSSRVRPEIETLNANTYPQGITVQVAVPLAIFCFLKLLYRARLWVMAPTSVTL
jgi:hypothetical protein